MAKLDVAVTINDLEIIENVGKACLPIYYRPQDLLMMMMDGKHLIYKLTSNDQIVGFVVASLEDDGERIHIKSLGVLPEFRRQGYGRQLVDKLKELLGHQTNGKYITLYVLEDNFTAVKFYARLGFKSVKKMENYYLSLGKSAYFLKFEVKSTD